MAKPSFTVFDYRVRPAKSVERKMLCEAFRRLSFFEPVKSYRYIGFGSTTFTDFILIHKALDITDMISIEKRKNYETRFEFNRPFHCVKMKYGDSNKVLPELTWDKRTIIWLDFEGHLTASELQDVAYAAMNMVSGSMLVVTLNVGDYWLSPECLKELSRQECRLEKLKEDVGIEKVPGDIEGKHLVGGGSMARTFRRLIMNEIDQVLRDRNGLSSAEHEVRYQPLLNFHYSDRANMLTVGGVFYEERDKATLKQCEFESLDFVRPDDTPYEIELPILTPRERQYLDKALPKGAVKEATETIGLTEGEIQRYARLYRHYPLFVEVELS